MKQILKSVVREIHTLRSEGVRAPNLVAPSTPNTHYTLSISKASPQASISLSVRFWRRCEIISASFSIKTYPSAGFCSNIALRLAARMEKILVGIEQEDVLDI